MPEPEDKHPVNVVTPERIMHFAKFRIGHLEGELEKMVNHETEDDQPAHEHRSRCHRRSLITGHGVLLRFRQAVLLGELNRRHDVGDKCRDQDDSHHPEDRPEIMQEFRIGIDPVLSHIDLKVPDEMSENVQDEKERGDGNDIFLPDGGLVKGDQGILGKLPGRRGGEGRYRHSDETIRISIGVNVDVQRSPFTVHRSPFVGAVRRCLAVSVLRRTRLRAHF